VWDGGGGSLVLRVWFWSSLHACAMCACSRKKQRSIVGAASLAGCRTGAGDGLEEETAASPCCLCSVSVWTRVLCVNGTGFMCGLCFLLSRIIMKRTKSSGSVFLDLLPVRQWPSALRACVCTVHHIHLAYEPLPLQRAPPLTHTGVIATSLA